MRLAPLILTSVRRHAQTLWGRIPSGRIEVAVLWAGGLALGALAFRQTLDLPLPAAIACWVAAGACGLILAVRAEPILWEEPAAGGSGTEPARKPKPAPPKQRRVRPLLDLVEIPGGTFRMGSPSPTEEQVAAYAREWVEALGGELEERTGQMREWLQTELPAHTVRLSPFLMARVPVTRGQWREVMPEAPAEWGRWRGKHQPATHVDWPQAIAFCNALSEREGMTPCYRQDEQGEWRWDRTADGYRLATEAEWEYACRAGTETTWFWGDDREGAGPHAWHRGNSGEEIKSVGGKTPNPWGLHDMAGLVLEWCWDRFGAYPEETQAPLQDPSGPSEGDRRVVRGGSFGFPPIFLRSAFRLVVEPELRAVSLGLRCVRSRARQP
jgi:formylglycine-generating enzyme required for sulfatase activity